LAPFKGNTEQYGTVPVINYRKLFSATVLDPYFNLQYGMYGTGIYYKFWIQIYRFEPKKFKFKSEPRATKWDPGIGALILVLDFKVSTTLCPLVYSDFNNFMEFTSKKLPNNILTNVCKKIVFDFLSHFLPICRLRYSKTHHTGTLFVLKDTQKYVFLHMGTVIRNTQNFTLISKIH
jgi:hypothetical protein